MIETANVETFSPHLGEQFFLHIPGFAPVGVTLIEATGTVSDNDPRRSRAPFSLLFRGPANTTFTQGTYHIEHPHFGEFDLFLVPIKPDAEGPRLEAIFT